MNSTTYTDLAPLKQGKRFTWGDVIKIHEIGDLAVVEYEKWDTDTQQHVTGFHGILDGKSTSEAWSTLDGAIAGLLSYKYSGRSDAGQYFMKMIGAYDKQ